MMYSDNPEDQRSGEKKYGEKSNDHLPAEFLGVAIVEIAKNQKEEGKSNEGIVGLL